MPDLRQTVPLQMYCVQLYSYAPWAPIKPPEHYIGRKSNTEKTKSTEDMVHNPKMTARLAATNYIKPEDERPGFVRKLNCGFHFRQM